jgi:quercetin dioxygenase-like cupin family protein
VRILDVGADRAREITQHGSRGFAVQGLVRGDDLAVTVLRVAAGGEIGRHPAPVDQLFVVVAGRGSVCGDDGAWHDIATGQAAVWVAGEQHTTRADEDLVAVVVEAPDLGAATA